MGYSQKRLLWVLDVLTHDRSRCSLHESRLHRFFIYLGLEERLFGPRPFALLTARITTAPFFYLFGFGRRTVWPTTVRVAHCTNHDCTVFLFIWVWKKDCLAHDRSRCSLHESRLHRFFIYLGLEEGLFGHDRSRCSLHESRLHRFFIYLGLEEGLFGPRPFALLMVRGSHSRGSKRRGSCKAVVIFLLILQISNHFNLAIFWDAGDDFLKNNF